LSAVRDCLFKIFIAFSSIRNLRRVIPWWRGTHLTWCLTQHQETKTKLNYSSPNILQRCLYLNGLGRT
jgi:hypothetical protein